MTVAASIIVAILAAGLAYWNTRAAETRRRELDRLDDQIKLLYGPLAGQVQQNDGVWRVFESSAQRLSGDMDTYWEKIRDSSADEHTHWKNWNEDVFVPLNEKICSIIAENAHLVREDGYSQEFALLNRHIAGWRAVIKEWQRGETGQTGPGEWWPEGLSKQIVCSFNDCLKRQKEVLGKSFKVI